MEIKELSQLDLNGSYTYADYLLWKIKERVELFKGKIFAMSPAPSRKHQDVSQSLNFILQGYFYEKRCSLYVAPFDVRLSTQKNNEDITTVVQPDLCVICDSEKLDERGCLGAPDLVIEILSQGNSKKEMKNKFDLYEEAGVREYWVVRPSERNITVYVLQNGKYVSSRPLYEDDVLASKQFPELKISIEKVFDRI